MKYPYTPEVLDALPESVAELFRQVEDNVLEGICTKLEAARYLARITVPDLKKLRDVSNKDIEQMIQDATGKGEIKIQSIMSEVVTKNTRFYSDMQSQMGLTSFKPILTGTVTTAIQQQTLDTYQNLSGSMGFLVDSGRTMLKPAKAYQWAIDNAIIQIQSGAMNYEQAIRYAVRTLAKSGIKTVSYESGKVDQMDVAVRRAVLTGANQLCLKFAEKAMDSLYTDLVEVSAHVGARNRGFEPENHEMWQGKVYRWSEKPRLSSGVYPDFIRHTGYGSGEGLGGWNCRHSFHAFVEGVSERTYTDEELDSMKAENRTFQYEGKEYDGYTATQKQRQIERTLRKLKRERSSYKAAGLTDEYNAVNAKIRRLTYKYRQFSKKAGLPEQRERTKVQYTDDNDLTVQEYRKVERGEETDFTVRARRTNITVTTNRISTYDSPVYVSTKASIKPKALHEIYQNTVNALQKIGMGDATKPSIVIVKDGEISNAAGRYDAITNTVYYTESLTKQSVRDITYGDGAVEFHEMWHFRQAELYRRSGKKITNATYDEYISELLTKCKRNVDSLGITEYNVRDISKYAYVSYWRGRYDEVEAEYMTKRRGK